MSDLLVDSPPNKRPKLEDPFQGSSDSSGVYSSNEMFDLENDLPDELISATPWNQQPDLKPNLGPQVPLQNGMIVQQSNPQQLQQPIQPRLVVGPHQLAHHFMGSTKHLVSGAGMSMNNKPINPNMPSPNVLVGKTGEPMVVNMGNAGINSNQLQNSITGINVANVANVNIMMGNNLVNNSMHNPHHGIPQQQQNGPMMGRNIAMHHPQQIRNQTPHQLHNLPINTHRLQAPMGAMSPVNNFNAYNQNNQQINVVQQQPIGIVRQQVPRFNANTNGMLVDTPVPPQSQANVRLGPQQVNMVNQNVVVPPQGVPPDRSQANPEKRKMITQQLVLLLHAHQCQRRDNQQANGEVRQCRLQHCNTMKGVLAHMTNCLAGRNCNVAHCSSSRQIISHWKQCTRPDCPICQPLKASNNRNALANNTTQNTTGMNDMNCYNTVNNQVNQVQGVPNNVGIRTALQSQIPHPPNNNVLTPNQNTRVLVTHSQPQATTPMSAADPSTSSVNEMLQSAPNTTVPVPSSIQQSATNIPNSFIMTTSTDTMTTQMNNQAQPSQSMPGNHIESKEWHESITPELRNHLVHKLVQAIFPTYDPKAMLDKRMNNLVAYARKVEGDMYNVANSRSEYYHRLAQTFYKIQKELEEKMQKRKEQQQMQQQQIGTQQPTNNINAQCFPTASTQGLPTQQQPPQPQQQQPLHHTSIQNNQQNLPQQVVTTSGIMKTQMSDRVHFPITSPVPGPSPNTNLPQTTFGLTQPPAQSPINTSQFPTNSPMMPNISQGSFVQPQFPNQSMNQIPQQIHLQQQAQQQQQQAQQQQQVQQQQVQQQQVQQQVQVQQQQQQQHLNNQMLQPNRLNPINMEKMVNGPSLIANNTVPSTTSVPSMVPNSMGKGYPRSEPSSISHSSQMNAIASALAQDDSPKDNKGEVKDEYDDSNDGKGAYGKGKMNSETPSVSVKTEIKQERDDNASCSKKMEVKIKDEPMSPKPNITTDIKPFEPTTSDSKTAIKKCIFRPDELRQALMPTLEKLYKQEPESDPFKQPVDPQALNIPDYFIIIKKPMDLSTIREKLNTGQFTDPWSYVDDVWLMFENAWHYNKKSTKVYKSCTKLSEVFEQEIYPVMRNLGYCCGRKYTFNPQVLCCFGKQLCTIPRDAKYFSFENRYIYCVKCFNDIPGDAVTLGEDPTQAQQVIKKEQFMEMKNDHLELEPFIMCTHCGRKLHQICVLHNENINPTGYVCDSCLKKRNEKRKENKFNAKKLAITKLGTYIETRVNNFLKKKEAGAGEVAIRVVSSSDKIVEVKPGMRSRFVESGEMIGEFPYRAKALYAFEEIDGTDVCFFGMHVQEYGSESPSPNTRRVYIAYLDSVNFFRPKQYRTYVYHEILLGYLDYVKQLGYTMAHIWACPPSEGDDYIFHCHPPEQKIPKPKRLQEWYKKMLDKGIIERIILDYKDILKQAIEDKLSSAAELPYFEGDFWPNALEDSIKELDQEEEQKRKLAEAEESVEMCVSDEVEIGADGKKKGLQKAKKSNKSKSSQRKSSSKKTMLPQTSSDLSAKIFDNMDKHKEVFFVIRLHSVQSAAALGAIQDPDPLISCDLMDGRDAFLTMAREKHYEFSSLRRAKFSSMAMLYELHNQGQDKFVYTCNSCKSHVETRYHCTVCDDFDLCITCYEKEKHPHTMEKLGLDLDDGSSPGDQKQADPQEARKLSIRRCILSLVHACQCRDANCRLASCQRMKRVVQHVKLCKVKSNGNCPICKQYIALCFHHAKYCTEAKCPVLFCPNMKHKIKQQQLQQRLQQAQLLRRRMAIMNTGTLGTENTAPVVATQHMSNQPKMIPHKGPVMVPGKQTPPANVLQVVKQVQEEAARQHDNVGYGKGGPQQQMQRPHNMQIAPPVPQQVNQWVTEPNYNQMMMQQQQQQQQQVQQQQQQQQQVQQQQQQVQQQQQQVQQQQQRQMNIQPQQQQMILNNQQNPMLQQQQVMAARPQGYQQNPNQVPNQSLQQLLNALRTNTDSPPEQQQRLREILRSNPQLLAQFIRNQRQRQMFQQQQQQQGGAIAPPMYPQQMQGQPQPGPQGPNQPQSNMQNRMHL